MEKMYLKVKKCFQSDFTLFIVVKNNFQFRTTISNLRFLEFRCLQEDYTNDMLIRTSQYKKSVLWNAKKIHL